jgi:hypothetical protein
VKDKTHLKFVIPRGQYCYNYTGRRLITNKVIDSNGEYKEVDFYVLPEIRTCPFWVGHMAEGRAFCTYLDSGEGLIFDQIKECGVNPSREKSYIEEYKRFMRNHPGQDNSEPETLKEIVRTINSSGQDHVTINDIDYVLHESLRE